MRQQELQEPDVGFVELPINAAAKIIADISTGIYRSPAAALKELVSNSFDAGATELTISTGYPDFETLTCIDDGDGIKYEDFRDVMEYIGGSLKREVSDVGRFGRPIIGKIGIGILALSQIREQFSIVTSPRGESYGFEARINVAPFKGEIATRVNLGTGKIGKYAMRRFQERKDRHYTIITTAKMGNGFTTMLKDRPQERFRPITPSKGDFYEFVLRLQRYGNRPLRSYDSMLFDLAAMAPLPYLEEGPIRGWGGWEFMKRRLEGYQFRLIVDGLDLRKPILLPTSPALRLIPDDYKIYRLAFDDIIDGERLKLTGYIFHQRKQILPPNLQGILVRVRNVGIGIFDKSLLNYPIRVGPMGGGICGEIYIEHGLERALNIDRNSFRETDPHFLAMQDKLFDELGLSRQWGIFRDIRVRSSKRLGKLRKQEMKKAYDKLQQKLQKLTGRPFHIVESQKPYSQPVVVSPKAGRITVYKHPLLSDRPKERTDMIRLLVAFELARSKSTAADQRSTFYDLIARL